MPDTAVRRTTVCGNKRWVFARVTMGGVNDYTPVVGIDKVRFAKFWPNKGSSDPAVGVTVNAQSSSGDNEANNEGDVFHDGVALQPYTLVATGP